MQQENNKPFVGIVVPTIRKESIRRFFREWHNEFEAYGANLRVYVIEDNENKSFDIEMPVVSYQISHCSHKEINDRHRPYAHIIPRKTDCVRSIGYLEAYFENCEYIITLDDDCYPVQQEPYFIANHLENLNRTIGSYSWSRTTKALTRGIPYNEFKRQTGSKVVLSHGLWKGIQDFDAPTQLTRERTVRNGLEDKFAGEIEGPVYIVPFGSYFPMCGMNLAWRRELTPAMYFLLMGQGYEFDRFGDIWCGIIVKKIIDHLNFAVINGHHGAGTEINHDRASNVFTNLKKEAAGIEANEYFWQKVDAIKLTGNTVKDCYIEVAEKIDLHGEYWDKLKTAMKTWAGLF